MSGSRCCGATACSKDWPYAASCKHAALLLVLRGTTLSGQVDLKLDSKRGTGISTCSACTLSVNRRGYAHSNEAMTTLETMQTAVMVMAICLAAQTLSVASARPLIASATRQELVGARVRLASTHASEIATPDRAVRTTG